MQLTPGQRVVCINGTFSPCPGWRATIRSGFPQFGAVYTIRSTCESGGLIGLRLAELMNQPAQFCDGHYEPGFNANNFRPLSPARLALIERLRTPAPIAAPQPRTPTRVHEPA